MLAKEAILVILARHGARHGAKANIESTRTATQDICGYPHVSTDPQTL